nr:proline-rich receptor-like protein kinase PERK9 [Penaeus vannamei]
MLAAVNGLCSDQLAAWAAGGTQVWRTLAPDRRTTRRPCGQARSISDPPTVNTQHPHSSHSKHAASPFFPQQARSILIAPTASAQQQARSIPIPPTASTQHPIPQARSIPIPPTATSTQHPHPSHSKQQHPQQARSIPIPPTASTQQQARSIPIPPQQARSIASSKHAATASTQHARRRASQHTDKSPDPPVNKHAERRGTHSRSQLIQMLQISLERN